MEAALLIPESFPDRHCLEQIVARSSEGILLLDARNAGLPIVFANPAFEALTGYRAGELIGKRWHVLKRERGQHRAIDELQAAVERGESIEVELPDQRKDGTPWISHVAFSALRDARGEVCCFLVQQREPSRQPRRAAAEIEAPPADAARKPKLDMTSRTDPSTGLPNYDHFAAILNRDITNARREHRPVSVMLFDIVELDVYRQTFGPRAADSCVRMIGAQLSSTLRRAGDLFARFDDTTLVAAVVGQDVAEATLLAERIVENVTGLRLHNPRAKSSRYVHVMTAIYGGVPAPDADADVLVDRTRRELAMQRTLAATKAAASRDASASKRTRDAAY